LFYTNLLQVRQQVQRQLAQALFKLSVEFRKEETRFLNKMEAQKGLAAGSSIGLIEEEGAGSSAFADPGFTETQLMKVGRLGFWTVPSFSAPTHRHGSSQQQQSRQHAARAPLLAEPIIRAQQMSRCEALHV
jgi:hypothetical protein